MKITVSKFAGFCFGVNRALRLVEDNLSKFQKPVYMLGELVHNEHVVRRLTRQGIKTICNIEKVNSGTVIITAHGISPKIITQLTKKKISTLDTTCPWVRRAHESVKTLEKDGRYIIIIGDKNHIEVKGIGGELKGPAIVISDLNEAKKVNLEKIANIGMVSQTTQDEEEFKRIADFVLKKAKNTQVLKTICDATLKRQADIKRLAKTHGRVIIIGSKNSANTQRLFQIARGINKKSFLISGPNNFKKSMVKGAKSVAISGGASTPKEIIMEVVKKIK